MQRRLALLLAAAYLAVGLYVLARGHPHEDAYILFKYADDLARGYGIAFYPGGPHAEGATDFLWMVALALGKRCHVVPAVAAVVLNAVGFGASAWWLLSAAKDAPRSYRALLTGVAVAALVASPAVAGYVGFSAMLFAATALGLYRLFAAEHPRAVLAIPGVGLLLGLLRPDGVVIAVVFAALGAVQARRLGVALRYAVFSALAALVGGAYFVWRWRYFGELLPLPLYVKSHYGHPPPALHETLDWIYAAVLPPLGFLLLARWLFGRFVLRALGAHLLGLLPFAVHILALLGGAPSQNVADRFQAPATLALLYFVVYAAAQVDPPKANGALRTAAAALGVAVVFYPHAVIARAVLGEALHPPYLNLFAHELAHIATPSTRIATTEAGRLAFWSDAEVLDLVGLNTAETAREPPSRALLERFHPDLVMFHHASTMDEAAFGVPAGVKLMPLTRPLGSYVYPSWRPLLAPNLPPYTALPVENIVVAPLATIGYLDDHAAEYDTFVARFESRHFHFHVYAVRRDFAGHDAVLQALDASERVAKVPSYLALLEED